MLGLILLAIGIVGFGLGAYWDLRYTEFPDWLPYAIIIASVLVRGAFSLYYADFSIITNSIIWGVVFLAFGLALYYSKQWGDGDAWLLGALGFLFPGSAGFVPLVESRLPFQMVILFNFFLISLFYLIGYSIFLGIKSPRVYKTFIRNLHGNTRIISAVFFLMLFVSAATSLYLGSLFSLPLYNFTGILIMPFLAILILLFFHYAKAVEGDLFKRKIPVSKLRVGDVLISDKWRGITDEEVKRLRKKGGDVWIKEGVRFAPVFIINMIVTLFYGSLTGVLFGLL